MPSPHEKRKMALNMLRNTFVKVAEKDDTISKQALIREIIEVFGVSVNTAHNYIQELLEMGMIKESGDMLWHSKETEIKLNYLDQKESEAVKKAWENSPQQSMEMKK